ncbi:MAG: hypothetical protein RSC97_10420 [Eubacterium sp.]
MIIEEYIKENIKNVADVIYLAPDIPRKKLNNAVVSIAKDENPNYVIAIVDTTLFQSGKEGCVFLGDSFYIKDTFSKPQKLEYNRIKDVKYSFTEKEKNNEMVIDNENLTIILDDDENIVFTNLFGINMENLSNFIKGIICNEEEIEYKSVSQMFPLEAMSSEIKVNYIKVICNFFKKEIKDFGNEKKEEKESFIYEYLVRLMVKIKLEDEKDRLDIRNYLSEETKMIQTEILFDEISTKIYEGHFDVLKIGIFKDLLVANRIINAWDSWSENSFFIELMELLNVSKNKVEFLSETIIKEESIISERKDRDQIKELFTNVAAGASSVGLPLAAVYFTGSVGVSAAGITSGLAALGLGGFLGFSSMICGIGVAIALGVGAFQGVKKIAGNKDIEINKEREKMIQEIIKNGQIEINYLIGDINYVQEKLFDAIDSVENTQGVIENIKRELASVMKAMNQVNKRNLFMKKEALLSKLPKVINIERIKGLTDTPILAEYYDFIVNFFHEEIITNDEGKEIHQFVINEETEVKDLEELLEGLSAIGYFDLKKSTVAMAKKTATSFFDKILQEKDEFQNE